MILLSKMQETIDYTDPSLIANPLSGSQSRMLYTTSTERVHASRSLLLIWESPKSFINNTIALIRVYFNRFEKVIFSPPIVILTCKRLALQMQILWQTAIILSFEILLVNRFSTPIPCSFES